MARSSLAKGRCLKPDSAELQVGPVRIPNGTGVSFLYIFISKMVFVIASQWEAVGQVVSLFQHDAKF